MQKHRFAIHIGGDNPDHMKEGFIAVMNAARALDEALRNTAPNGRNYYVLLTGEEDLRDDVNEYQATRRKAEEIRAWAEEGAMRVLEQTR